MALIARFTLLALVTLLWIAILADVWALLYAGDSLPPENASLLTKDYHPSQSVFRRWERIV